MFTPPPPPHTHTPQSVRKPQLVLAVLVALALTSLAARAEAQFDFRATAGAPVHLMRSSNGAAFTAVIDQHPVAGELRLKKRPVTPHEIARLEASGVTLAYLADPEESPPNQADSSSEGAKQGGPLPSVPSSFTIMRFYGYTYGGFWTNATRPSGKTTHWSSFNLWSSGYSSTIEHVAHSLFFDGTDPMTQGLKGNGMLIGKSSLPGTGCGPIGAPDYFGEIESFWHNGNALYPTSCSNPGLLVDAQTSNFALHANTNQWVTYWIRRNGQTVFTSPAINTSAQRPYWNPNNGGVLFTITGGDGDLRYPDYQLQFTNVATGWF